MRQVCFDIGPCAMRVALIIVTLSVGYPAMSAAQQAAAPHCQASGSLVRHPRSAGGERRRGQPPLPWASVGAQRFGRRARGARHSRNGDRAGPGVWRESRRLGSRGCRSLSRRFVHLHRGHWRQPGRAQTRSRFIVSLNPPTRTPSPSRIRSMRRTLTEHTTRKPCSWLQTAVSSS